MSREFFRTKTGRLLVAGFLLAGCAPDAQPEATPSSPPSVEQIPEVCLQMEPVGRLALSQAATTALLEDGVLPSGLDTLRGESVQFLRFVVDEGASVEGDSLAKWYHAGMKVRQALDMESSPHPRLDVGIAPEGVAQSEFPTLGLSVEPNTAIIQTGRTSDQCGPAQIGPLPQASN